MLWRARGGKQYKNQKLIWLKLFFLSLVKWVWGFSCTFSKGSNLLMKSLYKGKLWDRFLKRPPERPLIRTRVMQLSTAELLPCCFVCATTSSLHATVSPEISKKKLWKTTLPCHHWCKFLVICPQPEGLFDIPKPQGTPLP